MSFESVPPRSSIDYLLRTTQQHHVQLSAMADQKENILSSDAETYEAIVRDIYQIGQVLQKKKYFYLGLSYRFFFWGVIAAVLVFVVEFLVGV